jgi:hypothetical protein
LKVVVVGTDKAQDNRKRESGLVAIDKCLARTPDIRGRF